MRAYSTVKKNFHYGAPGLGDRIHAVLVAYNYGLMEKSPVTLHLTKYQWNRHKPESWPEITSLFPTESVVIMPHLDCEPTDNVDFVNYVRRTYDGHAQIYADHPQRFEPKEGVDLTPYLTHFPQLKAETQDIKLPKNWYDNAHDFLRDYLTLSLTFGKKKETVYSPLITEYEEEFCKRRETLIPLVLEYILKNKYSRNIYDGIFAIWDYASKPSNKTVFEKFIEQYEKEEQKTILINIKEYLDYKAERGW